MGPDRWFRLLGSDRWAREGAERVAALGEGSRQAGGTQAALGTAALAS